MSGVPADRADLLRAIVVAVAEAGDAAWDLLLAGCQAVAKADASPVTAADHAAEAILLAALAQAAPDVPVVAEEEVAAGRTPAVGDAFFLVDPIDGTRDFVGRGRDFTVNVGLVEGGAPTLGVVYAPAHGLMYAGDVAAAAAWRAARRPHEALGKAEPIRARPRAGPPLAFGSRHHPSPGVDAWLAAAGIAAVDAVGSSYKFALLAAGGGDAYPRTGPTMEWDTAAGDALLRAAGGMTWGPDGAPFRYGKPGFRNGGFVAAGAWTPPPIGPYLR